MGALWKLGRKGVRLEAEGPEADRAAGMEGRAGFRDICNPN